MTFIKGQISWNKGTGIKRVCSYCKKNYNPNRTQGRGKNRKYCSFECYRLSLIGKPRGYSIHKQNNPNWRGGTSILADLIRTTPEYKTWKESIFNRDKWTCQECHKIGGDMEAHHKKAFNKLLKEFLLFYNQFSMVEDKFVLARLAFSYKPFWDLSNGVTLCKNCHKGKRIDLTPHLFKMLSPTKSLKEGLLKVNVESI